MKPLVFTPLAEADLTGILGYIAIDRPQTALAVAARFHRHCELLASHPELGQKRPEFAGEIRSLRFERWVIFYRLSSATLEIHRVLDGARDLDTLFQE